MAMGDTSPCSGHRGGTNIEALQDQISQLELQNEKQREMIIRLYKSEQCDGKIITGMREKVEEHRTKLLEYQTGYHTLEGKLDAVTGDRDALREEINNASTNLSESRKASWYWERECDRLANRLKEVGHPEPESKEVF